MNTRNNSTPKLAGLIAAASLAGLLSGAAYAQAGKKLNDSSLRTGPAENKILDTVPSVR